jgi:hypothetical protein
MWSLWMARNSRRHGNEPRPLGVAAQWAIDTPFDLWQLIHPEKEKLDKQSEVLGTASYRLGKMQC